MNIIKIIIFIDDAEIENDGNIFVNDPVVFFSNFAFYDFCFM